MSNAITVAAVRGVHWDVRGNCLTLPQHGVVANQVPDLVGPDSVLDRAKACIRGASRLHAWRNVDYIVMGPFWLGTMWSEHGLGMDQLAAATLVLVSWYRYPLLCIEHPALPTPAQVLIFPGRIPNCDDEVMACVDREGHVLCGIVG